MQPLGPVETFQPALERTRSVLARPFRLGRSWKLAFCAYLALSGSIFLPLPLVLPLFPHRAGTFGASWVLPSFAVVVTLMLFAFYYLGSRMEFVLFDLVMTLEGHIAPLWRLRQPALIWRWIAIKLALSLPLTLVLFLPLASVMHRIVALVQQSIAANTAAASASRPPPMDPQLLIAMFSLYGILFAGLSVLFFASSLLTDFVLPVLALESLGTRETLRRALALVRSHSAAVAGFVAFRTLLTLLGLMAQYVAAIALTVIAAIPLALLAVLGYFALHTIAPPVLLAAGGVLLYVIFLVTTMYLQLGVFGTLMIFLRAYSVLFVAGRYPPLALWLAPQQAPPHQGTIAPPPPWLPPSPAV